MILIALLGHDQLIEAVYGGRYMEAAWQMPIHWIGIGCLMVEGVITNVFKASGLMFIGYAPQTLGAILAVVIGLALVPTLGQAGVIYAAAASMVLGVTFCLVAVTVRRQKISH